MKSNDIVKNCVLFDMGASFLIALVGLFMFFVNFNDSALKIVCFVLYLICIGVALLTDNLYKKKKVEIYKGSKIYAIIMLIVAVLSLNFFNYDKMVVLCNSLYGFATGLVVLDYFFYYKKTNKDFAKVVCFGTVIMLVLSLLMFLNVFVDFKLGNNTFIIGFNDRIAITFVVVGGLKTVINSLMLKNNK